MKKIVAVVLSLLFALTPATALAKGGNERFYVGYDLESSEEFNSSAFFLGSKVDNSSTIHGAYFALGDELKNSGKYNYSFNAANKIIVQGNYAKDFFAVGNSVSILKEAVIGSDVYVATNTLSINSNIPGSVFATASRITLEDVTIGGDLVIAASEIELKGDVTISGKFVYNEDINILGADNVSAGTTEPYRPITWGYRFGDGSRIIVAILSLTASIVIAIVFILIAKKFFKELKNYSAQATAKSMLINLGIGLGALILVPLVSVLLFITLVGIPAGLLLLAVFAIALILSSIVSAAFIGGKIMPKQGTILSTTIVLILFTLIDLIPVFGRLFGMIVAVFGFGIIVRAILENRKAE